MFILRSRQTVPWPSAPVQHYHIWFDTHPKVKDLDLAGSMETFLDHMQSKGLIAGWNLQRRTLGLCSADLGEWHCSMATQDLGQLQAAFDAITPRSGDEEKLHAGVWSKVTNLKFALYRDFPDQNRVK